MLKKYNKLIFHGRFGPHFSDTMEQQFRLEIARRYKGYTQFLLILITVLFAFFGVCDYIVLDEDAVAQVWTIRYVLTLPCLLLAYRILLTSWVDHYYQAYVATTLCMIIFACSILVYQVPGSAYHLYSSSLLALVMGGLTLIRIGFWGALFTALFYVVSSAVVQFTHLQTDMVAILYFMLGVLAMIFSVISAFSFESASRNEFYQKKLIEKKNNQLEKANKRLKNLVDIDGLTGIANRRRFDKALEGEWRRAMRRQYPLVLLMVDIDFFKAYNDKLGHLDGDETLRKVASTLSSHARRPGDLVARYGGEEFCIILPAMNEEEALISANHFCEQIRNLEIPHPDSPISAHITISIGVTLKVPGQDDSAQDLLKRADEALYLAKKAGRNRVEISTWADQACAENQVS